MSVAEATRPPTARTGKPSVLFVDDEKRVLNSMRAMFRRDYNLYLTTRGDEALKIIDENDIDVVVADQRMPIMTGVEVLTAVKKSSPDTVRILLTGYADLEAIEGAMNDGEVFRFLSKPCAADELRGTIKLATEIAVETTGAANLDPDDDSFLDAIAKTGVDTSAADAAQSLGIDEAIDFASTMVLSDDPNIKTATERPRPLPKPKPKRAAAPVQTAKPQPGNKAKPKKPASDPIISHSASTILEDIDPQNTLSPVEAQAAAAAILDDASAGEGPAPLPVLPGHFQQEDAVEIVMSGDSHEVVDPTSTQTDIGGTTAVLDVAATLSAPEQDKPHDSNPVKLVGTGKYKVSIIVFTSDEQFAKSIGRSLQDYFYTFQASNIARLMHGIQKIAPAVLITDVSEDPEVIEQLAAQLKQKVPEMVTMVASQHRDAELMVRLINHGQVFRMVDKPMSSTACKRHVREAIKKHIQLRDNPDLVQRHQVIHSQGSKLPASIGRLINGLGRVRGLWSRKNK